MLGECNRPEIEPMTTVHSPDMISLLNLDRTIR